MMLIHLSVDINHDVTGELGDGEGEGRVQDTVGCCPVLKQCVRQLYAAV